MLTFRFLAPFLSLWCFGAISCSQSLPQGSSSGAKSGPAPAIETLLSGPLEGAEGMEVILSHVTIPPNTALPKHWHPGEEFAYILEGTVTLWQKGKPDITKRAGEAGKVPLKQIHTAITGDEGVTLLVFRVHEVGQPQMIPVE